jgi:hypothetical protein
MLRLPLYLLILALVISGPLACTTSLYVADDWGVHAERVAPDAYAAAWRQDCTWVEFRQGDARRTRELRGDRRYVVLRVRDRPRQRRASALALTLGGLAALGGGVAAVQLIDGPGRYGAGVGAAAGLGMLMAAAPLWAGRRQAGPSLRLPETYEAFVGVEPPRPCRD